MAPLYGYDGGGIGPLMAILYLQLHTSDLRKIFFWAFIPSMIAVAIALTIKDFSLPKKNKSSPQERWKWAILPKRFKIYLIGWSVFSLVNSSDVFLLLKAKSQGVSTTTVILLYCLYNLTFAVLSPFLGRFSDVFGRKKCVLFGLVVFILVYIGFSVANEIRHFIVLFAIYGVYMAATDGVGKAFALDLVPNTRKASALGLLGTATGVTTLFASTVGGIIWEKVSPQATFWYGAYGGLVAFFIFAVFVKERESKAPF